MSEELFTLIGNSYEYKQSFITGASSLPTGRQTRTMKTAKCYPPLTPALSPAFAETASRRQAPGEREQEVTVFKGPFSRSEIPRGGQNREERTPCLAVFFA